MNYKKIAEKVALLKDGQIVDIDGFAFSAKKINEYEDVRPCEVCNVDCLCRGHIAEICFALESAASHNWYLFLES